ncbi:MAG: cytochrome C [Candidatus Cloacimonadota bacterium]|nr:MAG: cytochrome C [Candidatus Cloacimonadota bacterium]PIE78866.1 MAG: cytochrome C [Candidatus Delongbacteria bacterium]
MNYPIWQIPEVGGSILIAIVAITHVFIAHLAVGGGLFLVLTERKGMKEKNEGIISYVKRHTKFFLLLTMVYGGMTGVGIWWVISLISPRGTSTLIHNYVFGWGTEWVFFIGEIVALLIYYYRFDKMDRKDHQKIGWLYFIFAWLSLFIINGIIGFMLTPGEWLETKDFWHGFFNPSFFPALFFRTAIAIMLAGLFALVTAIRTEDKDLKYNLINYSLKWLYLPFFVIIPTAFWYFSVIPEESKVNLLEFSNRVDINFYVLAISTIGILFLGLVFLLRRIPVLHYVAMVLLLATGLSWMGGFEYLREIARKPYVIYNYMYSNSILKSDVEKLNKEGFLKNSDWSKIKEVNKTNLVEAGKELFAFQCMSCHTYNGYNGIYKRTESLTERGIEALLTGLGKTNRYMPPFVGTEVERKALSAYLARDLHGRSIVEDKEIEVDKEEVSPSYFDSDSSKYALFAFNDLGMHCISDNDKFWSFLPPANSMLAQLIKRGEKPEIITEGVEIRFRAQEDYSNPSQYVDFWDYSEVVYGKKLDKNIGLKGASIEGEMHKDPNFDGFSVHAVPVTPYRKEGKFNPYPVFTIEAYSKESGELLATTKVVAPTSTEIGCRNCHSGDWRWNGKAGLSDETSTNILRAHDRINNTNLEERALNGEPMLCQSCHEDPALGTKGDVDRLNFSTAIHGFHAQYLAGTGVGACNLCHPSNPKGRSSCSRGYHDLIGLNCTDCHGNIEDHAISLLKMEEIKKKKSASKLLSTLEPTKVSSKSQVNPRMAWLNEPDCLSCHKGFDHTQESFNPDSFNKWAPGFTALYRNRTDGMGVMCVTCHGAPHAVYGGVNKYGENRDNLQPMQYQGISGPIGKENNCRICHTVDMKVSGHHKNMLKN